MKGKRVKVSFFGEGLGLCQERLLLGWNIQKIPLGKLSVSIEPLYHPKEGETNMNKGDLVSQVAKVVNTKKEV